MAQSSRQSGSRSLAIDLERIAAQAALEFDERMSAGFVLPIRTTVQSAEGQTFKVRIYPTVEWATKQERALKKIGAIIVAPLLHGRVGQSLIFEHLEAADATELSIPRAGRAIGVALGRLSNLGAADTSPDELDKEFESWLLEFEELGLVTSFASDSIRSAYQSLRPDNAAIGMDYWDAMPHNFGWIGDELVLLDEKHLRESYIGVGLVKPSFFLDSESFTEMLAGFSESAAASLFADNRRFLELYYCGAALHYYVQRIRHGDRLVKANPRLRFYRGLLIRRSMKARRDRIIESLRFSVRHPFETIVFLAAKIVHPTSWLKLFEMARFRKLEWGIDEP